MASLALVTDSVFPFVWIHNVYRINREARPVYEHKIAFHGQVPLFRIHINGVLNIADARLRNALAFYTSLIADLTPFLVIVRLEAINHLRVVYQIRRTESVHRTTLL